MPGCSLGFPQSAACNASGQHAVTPQTRQGLLEEPARETEWPRARQTNSGVCAFRHRTPTRSRNSRTSTFSEFAPRLSPTDSSSTAETRSRPSSAPTGRARPAANRRACGDRMTTGPARTALGGACLGGAGLGATCIWSSVSNPPLGLALTVAALSFVLAGLRLLMPQESADRRRLWQGFLRYLDRRHCRAHERRTDGSRNRTVITKPRRPQRKLCARRRVRPTQQRLSSFGRS